MEGCVWKPGVMLPHRALSQGTAGLNADLSGLLEQTLNYRSSHKAPESSSGLWRIFL